MRAGSRTTFDVVSAIWANLIHFADFRFKISFFFFGMFFYVRFYPQVQIIRKSENDNRKNDIIKFQSKKQPAEKYAPKQAAKPIYLLKVIHQAPTFLGVEIDGG